MNNKDMYSILEKERVFSTSKVGIILSPNINPVTCDEIITNLNNEKSFNCIELLKNDEEISGSIEVNNKTYEVKISYSILDLSDFNETIDDLSQFNRISAHETEQWKKSKCAIFLDMKFNEDADESYFAQLKILDCINPNYILVSDESSARIISGKWVKMLLEDNVLPLNISLFRTDCVYDEDLNQYWLHTHGLDRCGCIELEMIGITEEPEMNYEVISKIGAIFIEKGTFSRDENIVAGYATNTYLEYTWKPWQEAIKIYKDKRKVNFFKKLIKKNSEKFAGDLLSRDESHTNLLFGTLFAMKDGKMEEPNIYSEVLKDDPVLFWTTRETEKQMEIAKARLKYLKEIFNKKDENILCIFKAGIETTKESECDNEYLWFELVDINENELKGILTNEPYYVDMKNGETYTISKENIADWIIYTKEENFNPDNIYRYYI